MNRQWLLILLLSLLLLPSSAYGALTDSLISYYPLDEASGARFDSVGVNDLTDNNTVLSATAKLGLGADFESGNSESLSITDASQVGLDITSDFSVCFWAQRESNAGGSPYIYSKESNTNSGYSGVLGAGSTELRFRIGDGSGVETETLSSYTMPTASFDHICQVFDNTADTVTMYVNGAPNTPTTASRAPSNNSRPFALGVDVEVAGTEFFDGILDEFGIWGRVLTDEEVLELYNDGDGLAYPFSTDEPTATTTVTEISYYDWIVVNGTIIFLLSFIPLGLLANAFFKKKHG